ncbi:mannonate oxidoreductase [Lachnospiraceae bacterium]|jgi:hypothetical protein|nr:mannonate oxidoreductase [Lachnospiraceae bacterium]
MKSIKFNNQNNYHMFKKYYESCQEESDKLTHASDKVSLLRGIIFATAGLLLFIGYQQKNPVLLILAFGLFLTFITLVLYHNKLEKEQEYLKDSQSVLKDYMARFEDGWKSFPVDGTRYLNEEFLEARDLDLLGKSSLYQYICTASTIWGQDQLALWLSMSGKVFSMDSALQLSQEIKSRQEAVAELSQKMELCMELEIGARRLRNIKYEKSKKIMDDFFHTLETRIHFPVVCRILFRLFPLLTLFFLFCALLGIYRHLAMPLFSFLAFAQLLSAFLGNHWNNKALSPIYQMNKTITPYRKLFQLLEREAFHSPYLKSLQDILLKNGTASAALKELETITEAVSARHNLYAFLLYNSLFLYDYHCMERYGKWKDSYRDSLKSWLKALGDAEALISLCTICRTRKVCCLPDIADSKYPVFTASDIRHPLINEPAVIGNDINLAHRTCIITGSNMSGKTTFMRSIGINLALAYAGGFCTAQRLHISLMKLCTSIRTVDNVNEGISTFYAELLRIKQMTEACQKQIPMISLIDEIYKGTNSKDRIFAAKETIRNLSKPYSFTLVTTHDFELCDLENDLDIDAINFYFTEYYKENRILFDYKLRDGRCNTTNARYLLRMAGILK